MKAILRSVSRSFYLTIRFLPRPLREPVSLAYLLARATDTIADTAEIPATFRLTTLQSLAQVVAGKAEPATMAGELRDFAARQRNHSEKALIENLPRCLDQLARAEPADGVDIRAVLATIVRGQSLDLERFGQPNENRSLQDAAELEEYTYLVAGCVGEFWTKLGFRDAPPFANRPPNEMIALGLAYGQGLQLINILRDRRADLAQGRGYLPADELAQAPEEEVFARWLDRAEAGISDGIEYCAALTNWRIRLATALPALIGARTIALLRAAANNGEKRKVKVRRSEVRRILAAGLLACASPIALRALYDRLRATEKAGA